MITEDFVSFEIAKLLKEKGFKEKCNATYNLETGEFKTEKTYQIWITKFGQYISASTLQMVMKWLREVHNIHIEIGFDMEYFPVCISTLTNKPIPYKPMHGKPFTYEEACKAGIKYCLENLI